MNAKIRSSKTAVSVLAALPVIVLLSGPSSAGQVQQIANFGNNPTGIGMYLYTPTTVASKPAVVVGVHACHGKGTDVCSQGGGWAVQADKFGFLLVCPSAVSSDGCWDVHSTADLTHNGGGDAAGIISMVNYVLQNKNGDATRVYVAGHSSGGMMTNVLIGSYPDMFKAGAAFAGVAFGCFAVGAVDSLGWNSSCANGKVTETGAQWGDTVRNAYPGFSGTRPRIQLWHGTVDAIVNFNNFGEEIKEWTNVLGVGATPTTTENNAIQNTWIRRRYTDSAGVVQVEAIEETGQPHNLVVDQAEAIHFFGLDGTSSPLGGGRGDAGTEAGAGAGEAGAGTGDSGGGAGGASTGSTGSNDGSTGSSGGSSGGSAGGIGSDATAGGLDGGGELPDAPVRGSSSGSMGSTGADAGAASGGSASGLSGSAGGSTSQGGGASGEQSGGCSIARRREEDGACWFWLLLVAGAGANARHRRHPGMPSTCSDAGGARLG